MKQGEESLKSRLSRLFGVPSKTTAVLAGAFAMAWLVMVGMPMFEEIKRWNRPHMGCSSKLWGSDLSPLQIKNGYFYADLADGELTLWRSQKSKKTYKQEELNKISRNVFEVKFTDPYGWFGWQDKPIEDSHKASSPVPTGMTAKDLLLNHMAEQGEREPALTVAGSARAIVDFIDREFLIYDGERLVREAKCF